jgi:hypothetical protein
MKGEHVLNCKSASRKSYYAQVLDLSSPLLRGQQEMPIVDLLSVWTDGQTLAAGSRRTLCTSYCCASALLEACPAELLHSELRLERLQVMAVIIPYTTGGSSALVPTKRALCHASYKRALGLAS